MNKLKLSSRLALGFGIVLALLVAIAGIGLSRMSALNAQLEDIVNVNNVESRLAIKMRISINQVAIATRNIVLLTDETAMKAQLERLQKARDTYDAADAKLGKMFDSIADTTQEERALLADVRAIKDKARPAINKVIDLGLKNKNEEATDYLIKEAQGLQQQWMDALGKLADLEDELNEKSAADAQAGYHRGLTVMIACCLVALAVGIAAALMLTRSVGRQIGGDPAYALQVVQRIADGDLATDVDVKGNDTNSLLAAMKRMQQSLATVVENIRSSSDSIATGSGQIATGNADLSQRTEEQASNLQQTAASMEQLHSTVQNNADVARQAAALANSATAVAAKGGEVVGQVVHTMQEISASSKKIGDIIGVIDGIAFQTNILALNAAVEAARAGEQGRGFAVVAGEVRSLASRSAEAAKEIKSLIHASVEKVGAGTDLVAEAGRTMGDIVGQVRRVNDLISEIGAATSEQATGIAQVNDAVTQLDQVTQQNAALVEESAAAAESLRAQAAALVEAVAAFSTSTAAAVSAATVASTSAPVTTRDLRTSKPASRRPAASAHAMLADGAWQAH